MELDDGQWMCVRLADVNLVIASRLVFLKLKKESLLKNGQVRPLGVRMAAENDMCPGGVGCEDIMMCHLSREIDVGGRGADDRSS